MKGRSDTGRLPERRRRGARRLVVFGLLLVVAVPIAFVVRAFASFEPITACEPIGEARPLCGWRNPEDMAALPGGRHVIVSEYGGMDGESAGTLALLDPETESRRVLYRGGSAGDAGPWGAADCPGEAGDAFSPHGIHVGTRADGRLQLLAVQHGGRESVEMFELERSPDGWGLAWRGCVVAPGGSTLNDVAATPDGGFLVTHMMPKRRGAAGQFAEYMRAGLFGVASGHVLAWRPGEGFGRLAGSAGLVPNGIEISPNGATVFVNYSGRGEVRRIDRGTGEIEARNRALPPLDNATWAPDGRLLVAASLADPLSVMPCTNLDAGTCPGAFAIFAVDPETLADEVIYRGGPGTPGGAGTVGLQLEDGSLLIGTFAGDRIVRVMVPFDASE